MSGWPRAISWSPHILATACEPSETCCRSVEAKVTDANRQPMTAPEYQVVRSPSLKGKSARGKCRGEILKGLANHCFGPGISGGD